MTVYSVSVPCTPEPGPERKPKPWITSSVNFLRVCTTVNLLRRCGRSQWWSLYSTENQFKLLAINWAGDRKPGEIWVYEPLHHCKLYWSIQRGDYSPPLQLSCTGLFRGGDYSPPLQALLVYSQGRLLSTTASFTDVCRGKITLHHCKLYWSIQRGRLLSTNASCTGLFRGGDYSPPLQALLVYSEGRLLSLTESITTPCKNL